MRILIALLLLFASPAGATSILYVSDYRIVITSEQRSDTWDSAGNWSYGDSQSATAPGESWSSSWIVPSLISTLSPTDITLELSVRRAFSYTTTQDMGGGLERTIRFLGPQDIAIARIGFQVTDPTPSRWTQDGAEWMQDLVPGVTYFIDERLVYAINTGPDVVTRSFSMRLVPEPGTALLLGFGVLALASRGRH